MRKMNKLPLVLFLFSTIFFALQGCALIPLSPPPAPPETDLLAMRAVGLIQGRHYKIGFTPRWDTFEARCVAVDLYAGDKLAWTAQVAGMRDRHEFCTTEYDGVMLGDKFVSRYTWLQVPASIVEAHPGAAWRLVVRAVDDERKSTTTGMYDVTVSDDPAPAVNVNGCVTWMDADGTYHWYSIRRPSMRERIGASYNPEPQCTAASIIASVREFDRRYPEQANPNRHPVPVRMPTLGFAARVVWFFWGGIR